MQRYKDTVQLIDRGDGKKTYETMYYPTFPNQPTDVYIISKRGTRMDLLAHEHYGDPRLWWVISMSNFLPHGTMLIPPGLRIRIPSPYTSYEILEMLREVQY